MYKKDYDIILVDFDGTIANTYEGVKTAMSSAFDKFNIPYDESVFTKMIGPPFKETLKVFFNIESDGINDIIKEYRYVYKAGAWLLADVYDGVVDMLVALKSMGKRLMLATSKPLPFAMSLMENFDLLKYFDFIGGAEDDLNRNCKKDVIEWVFDEMNITDKSRVVMLGDTKYDIEGATLCGIDSIGVLWGFGSKQELQDFNATYILQNPCDVVRFFQKN